MSMMEDLPPRITAVVMGCLVVAAITIITMPSMVRPQIRYNTGWGVITPNRAASACPEAGNTPGGADPWGGCWPGAHNTGYPHGLPGDTRTPVTLTTYSGALNINSCGTVIDSKEVTGWINLSAGNGTHSKDTPCLTIRNSLVHGVIHNDVDTEGPILVEDTEVENDLVDPIPFWENAGRDNFFAYRVNSHGGDPTLKCASYCETRDNWVHAPTHGGLDRHYNAIGGNGIGDGGVWNIEHNWTQCGNFVFANPGSNEGTGCSSDIGFYGDFAPVQNITVYRNFLAGVGDEYPGTEGDGPGYCMNPGYYPGKTYPTPINNTASENIFGRGDSGVCGTFGPARSTGLVGNTNWTWTNNRYEDGVTIPKPEG